MEAGAVAQRFPGAPAPSMALAADLSAPGVRQTSNGLKLLEKKEGTCSSGGIRSQTWEMRPHIRL